MFAAFSPMEKAFGFIYLTSPDFYNPVLYPNGKAILYFCPFPLTFSQGPAASLQMEPLAILGVTDGQALVSPVHFTSCMEQEVDSNTESKH
jgi:hypothetical protein